MKIPGESNLHLDSRSLSSDCDHCWVSSKLSLLEENARKITQLESNLGKRKLGLNCAASEAV